MVGRPRLAGIVTGSQILEVEGSQQLPWGSRPQPAGCAGRRNQSGTSYLLTPEGSSRFGALERRELDLQPVRSRGTGVQGHRLGYLRINQFSEPVPGRSKEGIDALVRRWKSKG